MSNCRSCGAPVIWALTVNGKPMPVEPDPRPDGNLEFYSGDEGEKRVRVLTGCEQTLPGSDLPPRYVSHFATCEFASKHRTKGKQ